MTPSPTSSYETPSSHAKSHAEFARGDQSADLTPTLKILLSGQSLTTPQTTAAFEAMMTGQCHHGEMGALLALLATRTPSTEEILGAAIVMRKHVDRIRSDCNPAEIVDTAGTGGAPKTFNVSTAAAIIAAAAGSTVAKHGNRSRTGRGSAEVLRELGVNVDAPREVQAQCLQQAGVCFCFAIHHHPATRHVMPVRQALGFPTIFNLLGPLTNPAGALRQMMGVYNERFLEPIAEALAALGAIRAIVMHSEDGLDEISISAPTTIMHVENGRVRRETITPEQFGLTRSSLESVTARDLPHAAQMIREVLDGTDRGPARDMTLLNAAGAILVSDDGISFDQAFGSAIEAIDSGAARSTLEKLVRLSQ